MFIYCGLSHAMLPQAVNGYEHVLTPPKMNADVCYWLNLEASKRASGACSAAACFGFRKCNLLLDFPLLDPWPLFATTHHCLRLIPRLFVGSESGAVQSMLVSTLPSRRLA